MVHLNPKPDPDALRAELDQILTHVRETWRKAMEMHGRGPVPDDLPAEVEFAMGVLAHVIGDSMLALGKARGKQAGFDWALGTCVVVGQEWCPPPEVIDVWKGDL